MLEKDLGSMDKMSFMNKLYVSYLAYSVVFGTAGVTVG
jgi:hypothetical protein